MDAHPKSPTTGRAARLWRRLLFPESPTTAPGDVPPVPSTDQRRKVTATIAVAAIPSAASLVWTAWSLIDMIPAPLPVGLAAGVVLDIALVSAVAIAWLNPESARGAKKFGWFVASIATALVGWHAYEMMPVLAILGIVPLVAKGLWHIALNTRMVRVAAEARQAEKERLAAEEKAKREAELSTDPSHEEQRLVAEKRRQAKHERELAEAEVELADAQAEREHRLELAKIRRNAEQQRALDREDATTVKKRLELVREINASRPASFALPSGEVPSDLSSLADSPTVPGEASLMGFGAVMGSDLGVSRGRPVGDRPVIEPQVRELLAYIATAGEKASVRGAAAELKVSAPTIRRWREKAEKQGLDMSALRRRTK